MKILHTSDWHLGKNLNGFSMIDDQIYFLNKLIKYIKKERVDVLIIAGDIYDKSNPSVDSVSTFNNFLNDLFENNIDIHVIIISGNHDNGVRLSYANKILKNSNIHIEGIFKPFIEKVVIEKDNVKVNFFLLPFFNGKNLKSIVNVDFNNLYESFDYYIQKNIDKMKKDEINILIAHGFISNSKKDKIEFSDELYIGSHQRIVSNKLNFFDYVALGHIHKSQSAGSDKIQYSGSILKYSIDESYHIKSVNILDVNSKTDINISKKIIKPLRDLKVISQDLDSILSREDLSEDDYLFFEIPEENKNILVFEKIKSKYKNLLGIKYISKNKNNENFKTFYNIKSESDIFNIFKKFYETETSSQLSNNHEKIIKDILNEL